MAAPKKRTRAVSEYKCPTCGKRMSKARALELIPANEVSKLLEKFKASE
jgi:hypothetical protein